MRLKVPGLLLTRSNLDDARPQQGRRYRGAWRGHFPLPFERCGNVCTGALT